MAALTGDINCTTLGTPDKATFSANGADTFHRGAIVWIDTGGGVQSVPAAGDRVLGISCRKQVTTAAGQEVEVYVEGEFWVPVGANITASDEGDYLMADADGTFTDNFSDTVSATDITIAENDAVVGQILRMKTGVMLVSITPGITGRLVPLLATNMLA